ncbi:isopenicillin N synthase family oxygenase [Diaphorobacter sp. HDW4A]|uniref:isopenicillin N synthase family dioxygenase n=1 Tax=Diaphorobacter sp. HDW4A TaxID=2714924 RepID=UPI001409C392|nr:isopenicillin N synthase family oxygenase [Diaphorobacter sp. HDW4A]QIL81554.1 isopenicillin N synthase family oxygenase [Diaphorobacter sp. HDW4A]
MSAAALALAESPVDDDNATALPVIDLSELDAPGDHAAFHERLARIARDTGFFYLEGHGIDVQQIRALERLTREAFQLPAEAKDRIAIRNTPHFRGYTGVGGEITRLKPDLREQLDFGEELPAVTSSDPDHPIWWGLQGPNQWPDVLPELKPAVLDWLDETRAVAERLLRAFLVALGQEPDALDALIGAPRNHRLKIIHYPGQPQEQSDQGVGAHKDGGLLTLLLQDDVGGLQVLGTNGWIDVPPRENAFVINIGEMLELATNGYLRANVHRVVSPGNGADRYSIAYFFSPSLHAQEVPLLALPDALAAQATGPESDPDNPLFRHIGTNALKGRIRSHLDVAERFYPAQFALLKAQAAAHGRPLQASAY